MDQNSEVNVPVDLDELCDRIKDRRKASTDEIKSMLINMDENQFKFCFLKLLRAAVEVKRSDAVEFIISKMDGGLINEGGYWRMLSHQKFSAVAYMVIKEILPSVTDQEFIIRLFEIFVQPNNIAVAKFLLDKIFAPLHHALWGDRQRY